MHLTLTTIAGHNVSQNRASGVGGAPGESYGEVEADRLLSYADAAKLQQF
jgi:hypothetical protein